MYHRVLYPDIVDSKGLFIRHLHYLSETFNPGVVPGGVLPKNRLSVCITFDDAYADFYQVVYPLLQKVGLKAVLAVPVGKISDGQNAKTRDYCSWSELREMHESGYVTVASHSYNHINVAKPKVDLELELIKSKEILIQQLQASIDTFVYPYGKVNKRVQKTVAANYRYQMRIGSALNFGWGANGEFIYRVDAINYWLLGRELGLIDRGQYFIKLLANLARGK